MNSTSNWTPLSSRLKRSITIPTGSGGQAWRANQDCRACAALEAAVIPAAQAADEVNEFFAACLAAFYATIAIASADVDPEQPSVVIAACNRALKEAKEAEEGAKGEHEGRHLRAHVDGQAVHRLAAWSRSMKSKTLAEDARDEARGNRL